MLFSNLARVTIRILFYLHSIYFVYSCIFFKKKQSIAQIRIFLDSISIVLSTLLVINCIIENLPSCLLHQQSTRNQSTSSYFTENKREDFYSTKVFYMLRSFIISNHNSPCFVSILFACSHILYNKSSAFRPDVELSSLKCSDLVLFNKLLELSHINSNAIFPADH